MLRNSSTFVRFAMFVAAVLAMGEPCWAQFGGRGGFGGGPTFSRQVILEGNSNLTQELIALVCTAISERHPGKDDADQAIRLRGIGLPWSGANVGDDVGIYNLLISYTVDDDHEWEDADDARLLELWEQARQELEQALRAMQRTDYQRRQDMLDRRTARLTTQRENLRHELEDVRNRLEELGSGDSGSQEQVEIQLVEAVTMQRQLSLDRVSLSARRAAIEERIDELRQEASVDLQNDQVVEQLEKIVQIREEQLAHVRTLYEAGTPGGMTTDLKAAEYELAQARIELFKARRAAINDAHGSILRQLNDELSMLFVQDAELQARAKALEEVVVHLREQTNVEVRLEISELEERIQSLRNQLRDAAASMPDPNDADDNTEISLRPLEEALAPAEEEEE